MYLLPDTITTQLTVVAINHKLNQPNHTNPQKSQKEPYHTPLQSFKRKFNWSCVNLKYSQNTIKLLRFASSAHNIVAVLQLILQRIARMDRRTDCNVTETTRTSNRSKGTAWLLPPKNHNHRTGPDTVVVPDSPRFRLVRVRSHHNRMLGQRKAKVSSVVLYSQRPPDTGINGCSPSSRKLVMAHGVIL